MFCFPPWEFYLTAWEKLSPHSPCPLSLGLNEMLGAELLWSTCSPVSKRSDGFKPLT